MVKKFSGYILIGVGLPGFFYFKNYRGNIIPLPTLWLILSVSIAVIGAYLIATAKTKKQIQKLDETKGKIVRIKEKGEKILIDFDKCDFKITNITQSNTDNFSRIQMIDALYDPNRNYTENDRTVTYIIYKHKNGDSVERFVSHPFPIDETTLKYYVSNNKIALYVDRFDRTQYFFNVE
jgi:hypothetical protein